ncbi:DUF551 domain-containing protein [Salmonella enterica]|nr:DUF551 domain-containing protein [Salmonella enterica]EBH9884291.1 DUF551 domain-containing protein [Salmonella enterica subsp. enterica serovar Kisarawe]EBU9478925.1 DUF550 domain-containing protein [Salmonella enterica subsp. enterica serovar Monschaui]EDT8960516.1 DUF551 domain-containing protein [Salmonella enterica subsp. enterica]EAU9883205.1 DUF551 domain-containing protein [Salmonella enterica]
MTTITKEWLQQTIAEFENTRDDIPFGLDDDDAKILIVLKQALALMDAGPVIREPVSVAAYSVFEDFWSTCKHPYTQDDELKDFSWGIWNACRDAMLKVNKNASTELPNDANLSTNSPVIPDGWISCSKRMPAQDDWVLIYSKYGEYLAGQVQGEYVELNDGTLSWLGAALHWMPLPEPPEPEGNNR